MIEKKIGLRLLYAFSMFCASLVFCLLLFHVSSKAADADDLDDTYYQVTSKHLTDSAKNTILTYWSEHTDQKCYVYDTALSSYTEAGFLIGDVEVIEDNGTNYFYADGYVYRYDMDSWNASPNSIYSQTHKENENILRIYEGYKLVEIPWQTIDWDNPYYSANIQSPNVNITYREFTSVPTVDVPLNVSFLNDLEDYYFESFALFCQPQTVMVTVESGQFVYDGFDYLNVWRPLVDMQDLEKPSDYSVDSFHLLMNDAWYNSRLTDGMIDFIYPTGFSAASQTNASSKFNNLRKNQCMACNQIYLYFRYFTVIDNQVVVGPWRIWTSYDPSITTEEIPAYIQPYLPAVGTTGTTTQVNPVSTSSPEPTQIYNPSSTGQNINIEVKQNVPNYPDYPTIATYNKDNLLVDTINSLNSFTQFFGDFGLFLTVAFGFIPEWIWGIIGVGFSLSIIVMFLKIL